MALSRKNTLQGVLLLQREQKHRQAIMALQGWVRVPPGGERHCP